MICPWVRVKNVAIFFCWQCCCDFILILFFCQLFWHYVFFCVRMSTRATITVMPIILVTCTETCCCDWIFWAVLSSNFRPPFWRLNALCHHATAEWAARQPSSRSPSHNGPHSPGNEWRRGGSKFNAQSCKGCNGWVDHDQGSEMLEIYLLTQRIVTKSTKQLQLYYCCLIDILRNV